MPQPGGMGGHSHASTALQKHRPLVPQGPPAKLHSPTQTVMMASLLMQNPLELQMDMPVHERPSSHAVPGVMKPFVGHIALLPGQYSVASQMPHAGRQM